MAHFQEQTVTSKLCQKKFQYELIKADMKAWYNFREAISNKLAKQARTELYTLKFLTKKPSNAPIELWNFN